MATSYTSLLGLALPVTGELSGTWGDTVNNAITSLLDTAVAGTTTVSADTTLTTTSGAANQARSAIILASGHVANITITAPAQSKIYTVINASGTYTVTFRGVGPTTGITLGANEKALLAWNGSDFVRIGGSGGSGVFSSITNTSLTSGRVVYSTTGGLETDSANLLFNGTTLTANTLNLTNALGTSYGGTGLTSFTSGGVVYASSGSALTTGSALTFDGNANFSTGGANPATYNTLNINNTSSSGYSRLFFNIGTSGANGIGVIKYAPGIFFGIGTQSDASSTPMTFLLNDAEQMRLTSTGLGIGTSSPSYKLDVQTSAGRFQVQNYGAGSVLLYSNGAFAYNAGTTRHEWQIAGSTLMTLDSSGNLGIGTTSPTNTLTVQGSVAFNVNSTTDVFKYYSGGAGLVYAGTTTATAIAFITSGGERMRLDTSGNLGIGTSSPAYPLDVNGFAGVGTKTASSGGGGNIRYRDDTATVRWAAGILGSAAETAFSWYDLIAASERMRLDSSGNLGLGATPSAWHASHRAIQFQYNTSISSYSSVDGLTMTSNGYASGATTWTYLETYPSAQYQIGNGSHKWYTAPSGTAGTAITFTQAMTLDASGNLIVGGTAAVYGTSGRGVITINGSSQALIGFTVGGSDKGFLYHAGTDMTLSNTAAGAMILQTNNTERARIDSSGNLGIGTSSPSYKLDVVTAGTSGARVTTAEYGQFVLTDGTRSMYLQNYVGLGSIGTSSNNALGFAINSVEKMRLDTSGNLIVGGTSAALGLVSVQGTGNYNAISAETSSSTSTDFAKIILRKTSTPPSSSLYAAYNGAVDFYSKAQNGTSGISGRILNFAYSVNSDTTVCVGNTRVSAFGTSSALGEYALAELRLGSGTSGVAQIYCFDGFAEVASTETRYDYFRPGQDNYSTLGASGRRWTTVYATTGTINTSDRNDKQDIEELSDAEQRVALRVKGLIRKFRFKDSVAAKGDNARIHFGVIAQDVQGAFTAEGLDASRYGLFCSDTFKAIDGKAVEKDENGQYPEGAIDYTRLGVRYEELLAFVISAI